MMLFNYQRKNNRVYNTPYIPQADACVKQKFLTYKTHKLDLEILYLIALDTVPKAFSDIINIIFF